MTLHLPLLLKPSAVCQCAYWLISGLQYHHQHMRCLDHFQALMTQLADSFPCTGIAQSLLPPQALPTQATPTRNTADEDVEAEGNEGEADEDEEPLPELSQARHVFWEDGFLPEAPQLREVFDDRFRDPRTVRSHADCTMRTIVPYRLEADRLSYLHACIKVSGLSPSLLASCGTCI